MKMESIQYGTQHGYNPVTSQFGQPGLFGGYGSPIGGSPFAGIFNSGIGGGLLGPQNIGRQPGQVVDGVGGMFQNYGNIDPLTAAHIQHAQLVQQAQQQLAQQAQIAQLVQQAQLAQQIAQQQQFGRVPSFGPSLGMDPISAAIAQQRAQLGPQVGLAPWLGVNPLNRLDPITAAYAQQAQIAQLCQQLGQQNQFGNPYGQGQFGPAVSQNLWTNPLGAQLGRTSPFQYGGGSIGGYPGQMPVF
jgi:hypothetical protein